MMLSRRLPRFFSRLEGLGKIISDVDATTQRTVVDVYCAEKALIQMQIEWEHFVRGLILDSAIGFYYNSAGPVVSQVFPQIQSREAAANTLMSLYNGNREPNWYMPTEAINAAIKLDLSNSAQIAAELGLTPWPIDELRYVRNFIAHMSKRSALTLRSSGMVPKAGRIDAVDVAVQYVSGGRKRYENWIAFAKGVAHRMVA